MRTITEAISECRRELNVRQRCYERWIEDGKLDATDATDRLERLAAAVHHLETAKVAEQDAKANAMPTEEELTTKTQLKSFKKGTGAVA